MKQRKFCFIPIKNVNPVKSCVEPQSLNVVLQPWLVCGI